jgi:hypothetical protein
MAGGRSALLLCYSTVPSAFCLLPSALRLPPSAFCLPPSALRLPPSALYPHNPPCHVHAASAKMSAKPLGTFSLVRRVHACGPLISVDNSTFERFTLSYRN